MQNYDSKIRIIENRLSTIMQLIENLEKNIVAQEERMNEKINLINSTIYEIKKELSKLHIEISAIKDQLPLFATKDRVDVIERYIDIIDPFSFVTRKEVERIVEKKIRETLKNMKNTLLENGSTRQV